MTKDILTVNELFSGIGAQRKAFERLGISHEVVGICEIDKYAIQSYEAIFGETHNYGDICTALRLDYADLWTYSFPCQDISVAGNQKGINENTRSGLLYQVQRLLEVAKNEGTLPKYLLLENVKNLVGKKFKSQFDDWLFYLDQLGYDTYWQVLNAKNYGIPQNRERVFAVSIRKDLNQTFEFPKPEELTIRLKDILEDEVEEKFYLKQSMVDYFIKNSLNNEEKGNGFRFKPHNPQSADVAFAVTTRAGGRMDDNFVLNEDLNEKPFFQFDKENTMKVIGASRGRNPENPSDRTVGAPTEQRLEINTQGTSNTITTVQKDNYVVEMYQIPRGKNKGGLKENAPTLTTSNYEYNNFVVEMFNPYNNKKVEDVAPTQTTGNRGITSSSSVLVVEAKIQQIEGNLYPNSGNPQAGRVYESEGISPALDTCQGGNRQPKILAEDTRIRKLTPLECWRLMGFDDEDFHKAQQSGVSNSQLYKQAGNSIVVNVLEKIFKNLFM